MPSIHDSEVLSYEVDLRNRKIVIHTRYGREDRMEYTDIIFDGVLCHQFEHQLPGSILLGVREFEPDIFFDNEGNVKLLERSKNYGWPIVYDDLTDLKDKVSREQYRYFVVAASYGFRGWVLAQNCSMLARPI